MTVDEVLVELRVKKPESAELYNMFVTETNDELIGTFNLRDLVVAEPYTTVSEIMKSEPVSLYRRPENWCYCGIDLKI